MTRIYRTVVGTYLNPDGTPQTGYIEFSPSNELVERPGARILPAVTTVILNSLGSFSVDLITTDNPTIDPTGWRWIVDEKISGGSVWFLEVPDAPSPLDISYTFLPNTTTVNPVWGALL